MPSIPRASCALSALCAAAPLWVPMRGEHAEHGGMIMTQPRTDYAALDRVVAAVAPLRLTPPVLVAPPAGAGEPWTAKSDAANRPLRAEPMVDGASGRVLGRSGFTNRKLVGWGMAIHEGQAFGWANQLLNLLTAAGLALMSVSAAVLWWRRRPDGRLGAPTALAPRPAGAALVAGVVLLGVLLPLFGLSLLAVLLVERVVLRRTPGPRRWLGLRPA